MERLDTGGTKKSLPGNPIHGARTPGGAQANLTLSSEEMSVNPAGGNQALEARKSKKT